MVDESVRAARSTGILVEPRHRDATGRQGAGGRAGRHAAAARLTACVRLGAGQTRTSASACGELDQSLCELLWLGEHRRVPAGQFDWLDAEPCWAGDARPFGADHPVLAHQDVANRHVREACEGTGLLVGGACLWT